MMNYVLGRGTTLLWWVFSSLTAILVLDFVDLSMELASELYNGQVVYLPIKMEDTQQSNGKGKKDAKQKKRRRKTKTDFQRTFVGGTFWNWWATGFVALVFKKFSRAT